MSETLIILCGAFSIAVIMAWGISFLIFIMDGVLPVFLPKRFGIAYNGAKYRVERTSWIYLNRWRPVPYTSTFNTVEEAVDWIRKREDGPLWRQVEFH